MFVMDINNSTIMPLLKNSHFEDSCFMGPQSSGISTGSWTDVKKPKDDGFCFHLAQ